MSNETTGPEGKKFARDWFPHGNPPGVGGDFQMSTDRGGPKDKTAHTIVEGGYAGGTVKVIAFMYHDGERPCGLCAMASAKRDLDAAIGLLRAVVQEADIDISAGLLDRIDDFVKRIERAR